MVFLCNFPPFLNGFKMVFMEMLSVEAAEAIYIVMITIFDICDIKIIFFYLYSLLQEYN